MAQVEEALHELQDEMPLPLTDPDYDAWFRRKVEAGLRDALEGRDISDDDMEAEADALCSELYPYSILQKSTRLSKTVTPVQRY